MANTNGASRRRHLGAPIPHEGENGLFSESWFPICLSRELPVGKIVGVDFLDGRVVAYRGQTGEARVMSAYCAHVGADLSVGDIQGDTIRCAFHHWRYDGDGVCVSTKVGDPRGERDEGRIRRPGCAQRIARLRDLIKGVNERGGTSISGECR